jgi:hypothetical protein
MVVIGSEQVMAFATPVAIIISILLQQRAAEKAAKQAGEIHTMVNNNLTAARAEVIALQKQVTELSVHIALITGRPK